MRRKRPAQPRYAHGCMATSHLIVGRKEVSRICTEHPLGALETNVAIIRMIGARSRDAKSR